MFGPVFKRPGITIEATGPEQWLATIGCRRGGRDGVLVRYSKTIRGSVEKAALELEEVQAAWHRRGRLPDREAGWRAPSSAL